MQMNEQSSRQMVIAIYLIYSNSKLLVIKKTYETMV